MRRLALLLALASTALPALAPDAPAAPPPPAVRAERLPPAATAPEPALPAPAVWRGPEAFPRIAGTGRFLDGGLYWTDFLYDDHGAVGDPSAGQAAYGTYGTPSGSYTYHEGPAANNGADIFRAAVVPIPGATRFRVDWNTLVDHRVPIATFGLDTDDDHRTDLGQWPNGVRAAGTDRLLTVSSHAAWLSGQPGATLGVWVDRAARSFVVDVPHAVLPPEGRWRVRLTAGLAAPDRMNHLPAKGALPGQPAVYNVGFRRHDQEPPGGWREAAQADALADGDITPFSATIDWRRRDTTPEPAPRGSTNRWYVSRHEFGDGVLLSSEQVRAKFLGRVQPYSLYVPPQLDLRRPHALTILLHSFSTAHTQYERKPELLRNLCDRRNSICVTPLGRGPDGFNVAEAELDLWEVWRQVHAEFRIDRDRTTLWGYSMGAIGALRLAATHPHAFAATAAVAGGSGGGGVRAVPGGPDLGAPNDEVNTTPLLANLRAVPVYLAQGALDELNPLPGSLEPPSELDRLGYRHRWELFPAEDHVVFALKDGFASSAAWLGATRRDDPCPPQVVYRWFPRWDRPELGVRTTGAHWVHDPVAHDPARLAGIRAVSGARPSTVVEERTAGTSDAGPSPALYRELRWRDGPDRASRQRLVVSLTNVAALGLDLGCAGLGPGASIDVTSDAPVRLRLGDRTVRLGAGRHVLRA